MKPYRRLHKLTVAGFLIIGILFSQLSYAGIIATNTLVVETSQYPQQLKKYNPSKLYVVFYGSPGLLKSAGLFLHNDTIINLKKFIEITQTAVTGYRLIYESNRTVDSVWQTDTKFRLTDKAYSIGNDLLRIVAFDSTQKETDRFILNYGQKYKELYEAKTPTLAQLFRKYEIYNSYDRNKFAFGSVWMLSIGIDDYGKTKWENSKSDASSYVEFFKKQFGKTIPADLVNSVFHEYLLLDSAATKAAIISVVKEIAANASPNDYFIFNFSGQSNLFTTDSVNYTTYFFPYDVTGYIYKPANRNSRDTSNVLKNLISLNVLQEYIQLIPANNQLFISEAGPSKKFKTEFIKTMMQNSPTVASILNKNRIIIVPNEAGFDNGFCLGKSMNKGPINYFITSLEPEYNIYDIFKDDYKAESISYKLKNTAYNCQSFKFDYFDVFFQKKFLQQYKDIFDDGEGQTRGLKPKAQQLKEAISGNGKQYALVVGTDNYKAKDWNKLLNPVYDAIEVADELKNSYGYEVQLLKDPPMDTIYNAIREYYRKLQPDDQLIIYFAGHGDFDEELLDDGFIVCSDSRSIETDPVRNSYIQHSKLKKMINKIPAKQILVLLDICHGGVFDENVLGGRQRNNNTESTANRNVLQFLKDKSQYKIRRALSSVGKDAAFDGKAGKHSPFANYLLQVLRARGGGSNGIVTLADIFAVLQSASLNETATLKISPHMAGFGDNDPLGEYVLIPAEKSKEQ